MNQQHRADERSLALHLAIADKLLGQPQLWEIPSQNLLRWQLQMGQLPPALQEWKHVLNTWSRDHILALLKESSQSATRLRSSSPFAGVLTESERLQVFQRFIYPK
jgi:hypothetical protein